MRKPHKVRVQFLQVAEDRAHVLIGIGGASAHWRLRVHVHALKKHSLTVEQNARPVHANVAEPDMVCQLVLTGTQFNLVELGRLGRPQRKPVGLDAE